MFDQNVLAGLHIRRTGEAIKYTSTIVNPAYSEFIYKETPFISNNYYFNILTKKKKKKNQS